MSVTIDQVYDIIRDYVADKDEEIKRLRAERDRLTAAAEACEKIDNGEDIEFPQPHPRILSIVAGNRMSLKRMAEEIENLKAERDRLATSSDTPRFGKPEGPYWKQPADDDYSRTTRTGLPTEAPKPAPPCDHPWHRNPGLITGCPQCGEGGEEEQPAPAKPGSPESLAAAKQQVKEGKTRPIGQVIESLAPADPGELERVGQLTFDRLRSVNVTRCEQVFHKLHDWSPTDWATAMAGECGEACNAIKKIKRLETGTNTAKDPQTLEEATALVGDELADTVIYADLLAARLGINLGEAVVRKFNVVSDRMHSSVRLELAKLAEPEPPEPKRETREDVMAEFDANLDAIMNRQELPTSDFLRHYADRLAAAEKAKE